MRTLAVVVLTISVSSLLGAETAPIKGTLCFVTAAKSPSCHSTAGPVVKVAATESERSFVWSSSDGKSVVAGVLAPKAEEINVADKDLRLLTLSVRGDRRHGWPGDLRVRLTNAEKKEWSWTVPAKSAEALSELRLPAGKYTIVFAADHHLSESRRVDLAKNGSLREVDLRPMPLVSGRVVSMKDEPLGNAQIIRADRKLIATTDEQGSFRGEVGDPAPDSLFVEKSGFGARLIPLQLATGDADLGVIRLGEGVRLTLHIVRPESVRDSLRVGLQRKSDFKYQNTPIGSKELAASDDRLAFDDLSKGQYYVTVEGKDPLEKLTTAVDVGGDANVEKEIRIEPYHLDGTARIGEDAITGEVGINAPYHTMQVTLPIENGRFGGTLWQHGKFFAWVKAKALGAVNTVTSPELGSDPSTWNIQFPKRFIQGRIFDAETKQPVRVAKMNLLITSGDSRLYTSMSPQDDGTFSITSTNPGTYELKVSAPEYVEAKQTIEVREDDGSIQRDFALTHGLPAVLEVVWPSGAPVVDAEVLEGVASDGHNPERHYILDASGRLELRLSRGESRTLYIVPREGSFAIARIAAREESEAKPLRVVVPPPAASLQVHVVNSDGKSVPAMIGVRLNGELIPNPVVFQIGMRDTARSRDFTRLLLLPAGAYEVWPMSPRTFAAIGPAKSVGLTNGEAQVELIANP